MYIPALSLSTRSGKTLRDKPIIFCKCRRIKGDDIEKSLTDEKAVLVFALLVNFFYHSREKSTCIIQGVSQP